MNRPGFAPLLLILLLFSVFACEHGMRSSPLWRSQREADVWREAMARIDPAHAGREISRARFYQFATDDIEFREFDTNHDGALDVDEFRRAHGVATFSEGAR